MNQKPLMKANERASIIKSYASSIGKHSETSMLMYVCNYVSMHCHIHACARSVVEVEQCQIINVIVKELDIHL